MFAGFAPKSAFSFVIVNKYFLIGKMTMKQLQLIDPNYANSVLGMVCEERSKSLSKREWLHRLKGLGLYISDNKVFTMRRDHSVCELPPYLCE